MSVAVNLFKIEILVLRAWSQMISSATGQICLWFQVSGVRFQPSRRPKKTAGLIEKEINSSPQSSQPPAHRAYAYAPVGER
jgi:hypothetical protein